MKLLRKNARARSEEICTDLVPDRGSGVVSADPAVARPIGRLNIGTVIYFNSAKIFDWEGGRVVMANDSSSKRFEQDLTWLLYSFGEIRVGSNPTLLIFAFSLLFLGVNSTLSIINYLRTVLRVGSKTESFR